MTKLIEKISLAKLYLKTNLPFVGFVLYQTPVFVMPETEAKSGGIAYTNGLDIYVNADFLEKAPQNEINFLLAHECGHIVLKSTLRRRARNPLLWNYATDFVINQILIDANLNESVFKFIKGGLYDKSYTGLSAEQVYEELLKKAGFDEGIGEGVDGAMEARNKALSEKLEKIFRGKCIDPNTGVGKTKSDGTNELSESEIESLVNERLTQAAQRAIEEQRRSGNSRGLGDGAFMEYVEVSLGRQISWREILKRTLRTIGFEQNDYSRPSRRTIVNRTLGCKYYYPRLRGITAGDIMMVIDTSASVSSASLSEFLSEINSCLRAMPKTKVYLYCADSDLVKTGEYTGGLPTDDKHFTVTGRGGTRFEPAFEEAEKLFKQGKRFETMIYFTDGCCDYPDIKEQSLPFKVIWCMDNLIVEDAPFGKTIRIDINY